MLQKKGNYTTGTKSNNNQFSTATNPEKSRKGVKVILNFQTN